MRTQLKTAALAFGITCALLLVGQLVFAIVGEGLPTTETLLPWLGWALGWKVVIWAALLAALAIWRPRTGLHIASAAVAATLDILLTSGGFLSAGGAVLLLLPSWALTIGAFTAVAAIGCLLARSLTTGSRAILPVIVAVVLTVGGALTLGLPYQWFRVYFTIWGPAPTATDADAAKYTATAITALALILVGLVLAIVQRRTGLIVVASLLLGAALLLGFVFQVPQGRWVPSPQPVEPYNSDYVPCYGEGDPNCVGG